MAKKANFKTELGKIMEQDDTTVVESEVNTNIIDSTETPFILERKKKNKNAKKTFPVYMDEDKVNKLDKICNETGYTRNELINKMIENCLENIQLK